MRVKHLRVWLRMVNLALLEIISANHHGSQHVRWHVDASTHFHPNHYSSAHSTHHDRILEPENNHIIPMRKRGELLSSHPPVGNLVIRSSTCSIFRKLSRTCDLPNSIQPSKFESHYYLKPRPIDILNHPNHLIARHITLVKRHSYGHQYQKIEDDSGDNDSDDQANSSKDGGKDSGSSSKDENNDNDVNDSDSSADDKDSSGSASNDDERSSSRHSSSSGHGLNTDKDNRDDDDVSEDSGSGNEKSDGKSRYSKQDDSSSSGDVDTDSKSVSHQSNSSGDDHGSSTQTASSATSTITSDNAQANPTPTTAADQSLSPTMTSHKHRSTATSANHGSTKTYQASQSTPKPISHNTSSSANDDETDGTDDDDGPKDQCMIMDKFFEELGGSNWINQDGWTNTSSEKGDCCGYFGLACDPEGRIVSTDLANNGLVGGISSAMFGLRSLIRLNLSSNTLVGPLPDEFQKLPNLTTILLDSTGLGAEIPGSLQELPNLVSVHLSNNSFQGNVSFSAATGLTQLYLSRNKFSGPIDLTTNVKIEKVVLDDNEFTGPLPDLSVLPMLKVLSVARNHFVGLPPNLTQPPSNLTSLDIQSNSIVGPYPDPINATALQVLSLNGNTFTGQFPRSQAPPSLKTCHIDHVPTASCPPAKVQADLGSLANKCRLVCGKTEGSRDLNRAHEGQTDPIIDPHTVPQSTSSASTTGSVNFTIAFIFHMLLLIRFVFWYT